MNCERNSVRLDYLKSFENIYCIFIKSKFGLIKIIGLIWVRPDVYQSTRAQTNETTSVQAKVELLLVEHLAAKRVGARH